MSTLLRALSGVRVGLSISESENVDDFGFPKSEINRTVVRFVSALLGQGASVCFGHDWRDDGVMESVHAYAERYLDSSVDPGAPPLLLNVLPWPDKPRLGPKQRQRLRSTLEVKPIGLPPGLPDLLLKSRLARPLVRQIALTYLRRHLTTVCQMRVCVGGRTSGSQGRYPGIVEESLFAIQAGQPTYLAGFLGGATEALIKAIKRENQPRDIASVEPPSKNPRLTKYLPNVDAADLHFSPEEVWDSFASLGVQGLGALNHLSVNENERLFDTRVVDEAIELILSGMGRAVTNSVT